MWWFDTCTYCEMFTTVRLLSTSFTSCNCHCCYCENILNLLIATFKYTVQYCHHGHQAMQGPFNPPKLLPLKIWNFCSPPLPHPQTLAAEILLCASMSSSCCLVQSCLTHFRSHGLQPTRLLCSWDSPGHSTRMGCLSLLQGIFPT